MPALAQWVSVPICRLAVLGKLEKLAKKEASGGAVKKD